MLNSHFCHNTMAEKATWKENVGQIYLSNEEECFWMFPTDFFCNKKLCITSPWFSHENETWRFVKIPGTCSDNYVTLYVWRKVCRSARNIKYTIKMSLKTLDNYQTTISFGSGNIDSNFGCELRDFCNIADIRGYLVSRCGLMKLIFVLQKNVPVTDSLPSITPTLEEDCELPEEHEKTEEPEVKGIERLVKNLKELFLNEQNSDFVLKAEDREFRVHKAILAARSPVFASMLQHDMVEKNSGMVDIPDCTAESFEVFLLYLYSGCAETMSRNNVFNLYYVADKYRVDDLKQECVEFMMGILSIETFCDVIALSLRHGESTLQKEATRFFRQNIREIIKTVQWQNYMTENPTHANELLIKALNA